MAVSAVWSQSGKVTDLRTSLAHNASQFICVLGSSTDCCLARGGGSVPVQICVRSEFVKRRMASLRLRNTPLGCSCSQSCGGGRASGVSQTRHGFFFW